MRALDLDLVRRRPVWPAWLLLGVGGLLFGDALLDTLRLRDEMGQVERRRGSTPAAAPALKEPVNEQTRRELDVARQALQELALPWEPLFKSIESSVGTDTALLSIEPDAGKRMLRISGEARSYPSILSFMVRLEKAQVLTGVHLISHQLREELAERPVQFTLAASWRTAP
jgi:hypothetical protein